MRGAFSVLILVLLAATWTGGCADDASNEVPAIGTQTSAVPSTGTPAASVSAPAASDAAPVAAARPTLRYYSLPG